MSGFVYIEKKIMDWEWWHDINTYRLFTYMIFKAYWKPTRYMGNEIPRGAFVASLQTISADTDLTISEVRTALSHLEKTGEITRRITNHFTVFYVNNYNLYQSKSHAESHAESQPIDMHIDKPLAQESQAESQAESQPDSHAESQPIDKPFAHNEEEKEYIINKDLNNITPLISPQGETSRKKRFVKPSPEEIDSYCSERGNGLSGQEIFDYYEMVGWTYGRHNQPIVDWKAAVRNVWERNRGFVYKPKEKPFNDANKKEPEPDPNAGLDKCVIVADDESNWDEYRADLDAHPGSDGWRVNDDGYWCKA